MTKCALTIALVLSTACGLRTYAQSDAQVPSANIAGAWQGTLRAGKGFQIILKISKAATAGSQRVAWEGALSSINPAMGAPEKWLLTSITLQGEELRCTVASIGAHYEGKLSSDGRSISGVWTQGKVPRPLNLERTAQAASGRPAPEALRVMPPNAAPEFEVAAIRPTAPNWSRSGFHMEGRRVTCDNQRASDIISFAYNIDLRQIVNGPEWIWKTKYTVNGTPNIAGTPDLKQMRGMYKSLLASRFHLALHRGTKVLPVYVLKVGRQGPKLAKSLAAPDGVPDQTFTSDNSRLVVLRETNATMADFAGMLDWTLDRPVIDETGLGGGFDFVLKWTPGNAPVTNLNAPPDIFTAIQEQIGLKLQATKSPAPVLVIDHIERPSGN